MSDDICTARFKRSLPEAFGPYTSREIHEPKPTDYPPSWWRWMTAIACVTAILVWITK